LPLFFEFLNYEKDTGIFKYRKSPRIGIKAGDLAGSDVGGGYRVLGINYVVCRANRLAWAFVHGALPELEIDHIDGNKTNDKIENLREVTHRGNAQNGKIHRAGRLPGASRMRDKWRARTKINGQEVHIGIYATEQEAHFAYMRFHALDGSGREGK
jgi:hypothetical protein